MRWLNFLGMEYLLLDVKVVSLITTKQGVVDKVEALLEDLPTEFP